MDDFKVKQIRLEDGRHGVVRVKETDDERVEEVLEEPERELVLSKRLIEKKRPVVVERTVERLNKSGEVVERKTESIEPESKMELRSHIARVQHKSEAQAEADELNAPVTRAELKDVVVGAVKAMQAQQKEKAPRPVRAAEQEVADRVSTSEKWSWKSIALYVVIAAQVAGLAYIVFWM